MDSVDVTTPSSKLYDVIIIGGSYAGLSAALTLYRAVHTCLIFDSGKPRNVLATRTHLTSGWENESPQKSRETSRKELESSGLVDFASQAVQTARKKADGTFEVVDSSGAAWSARKILLAIGVQENFLDLEGYTENYGKLIYYCMFCFGYEHRGSASAGLLAIGVLADPKHAITNAEDARKFVENVTIYTDGDEALKLSLASRLTEGLHVDERKITKLCKNPEDYGIEIHFESGEMEMQAFLVHKPSLNVDLGLPRQLGVECVEGFGIKVIPPFNQTNIRGVYAAGDCCSMLRMIPNAMSMGSFAGCGLARELPPSQYRKDD